MFLLTQQKQLKLLLMKKHLLTLAVWASAVLVFAQDPRLKGYEAITESTVRGQLEFLASDWMEGRATGERGISLASDYIASMFKVYNIQPLGDELWTTPSRNERTQGKGPEKYRSYFQNFSLIKYKTGENQKFSVINRAGGGETAINFAYRVDFDITPGSQVSSSGKTALFFAGYGFSHQDYDDYRKTDIKGKTVLILKGFPGHRDSTSLAFRKFHPENRNGLLWLEYNKIRKAQELGAAAIILVDPDNNPTLNWAQHDHYPIRGTYYEADRKLRSFYDYRMAAPGNQLGGNIPVIQVSPRAGDQLIAGTDINFQLFEKRTQETMTPASVVLPDKEVVFETSVESAVISARNVVGYIEGKNKDEYLVIGAHYDHLGKFEGWTWNGADDNASGTVGVLTLAKAFAESGEKPEKSIIFAAWAAEEQGMWGSKHFVATLPPEMQVIYNLNLDMIGRSSEKDPAGNSFDMIYSGSTPGLQELTRKNIENYQLELKANFQPSKGSSGGSDHAPFAEKGIPFTFIFSAMHPDYHQPSDELGKINWQKMVNLIRLGYLNVWDLLHDREYLKKQ